MLCLCAAQLKFWFQTDLERENSASCYSQGRQLLLPLRWSRSASNFYALIGQNLTGEFMWKIYAASWIWFTLTAEADRVFCQLVMFFTVFYCLTVHRMPKMKYSCYQQSSVIHGWFVYWIFGWEMRRLSKLEIRFWMTLFSFITLLDAGGWRVPQAILALPDSFQELHLEW